MFSDFGGTLEAPIFSKIWQNMDDDIIEEAGKNKTG